MKYIAALLLWLFGSGMILATSIFFLMFYLQVKGSIIGKSSAWAAVSVSLLGVTVSSSSLILLSGGVYSETHALLFFLFLSGLAGVVCSYYLYNAAGVLSQRTKEKGALSLNTEVFLAGLLLSLSLILFLFGYLGYDLLGYGMLTSGMFVFAAVGSVLFFKGFSNLARAILLAVMASAVANMLFAASGRVLGQNIVTSLLFVLFSAAVITASLNKHPMSNCYRFLLGVVLLSTVTLASFLAVSGFILQDPHMYYEVLGGGVFSPYTAVMFLLFSSVHIYSTIRSAYY